MPIVDDVTRQLTEAMRARDAARVAALRAARAAFQNEMKRDGASTLSDDAAGAVLRRLAKQYGESIEAYESAGRAETAERERAELAVLEAFLPRLADEDATRAMVRAAIAETGASGPGDVGRVMGAVMKKHKGEVDGALAKRLAAEELSGGGREG